MISIKLRPLSDADVGGEHCRALSSDEDSFCEARGDVNKDQQQPLPSSADPRSSGYSSFQSVSPSSTCSSSSSALTPCTFKTFTASLGAVSANTQPGFRLLVPMQRPRGTSTKQVKRKNTAAHSGGEVEREKEEFSASAGFLSLWEGIIPITTRSDSSLRHFFFFFCRFSRFLKTCESDRVNQNTLSFKTWKGKKKRTRMGNYLETCLSITLRFIYMFTCMNWDSQSALKPLENDLTSPRSLMCFSLLQQPISDHVW